MDVRHATSERRMNNLSTTIMKSYTIIAIQSFRSCLCVFVSLLTGQFLMRMCPNFADYVCLYNLSMFIKYYFKVLSILLLLGIFWNITVSSLKFYTHPYVYNIHRPMKFKFRGSNIFYLVDILFFLFIFSQLS